MEFSHSKWLLCYTVATYMTQKIHSYGFIRQVIGEGKLQREKHWDNDTMLVQMPDPATNVIIRKEGRRDYFVTPVRDEEGPLKLALERFAFNHNVAHGYSDKQVGELLLSIRKLYCNEHYRPEPMLPFQEGVDARAHDPKGQREL